MWSLPVLDLSIGKYKVLAHIRVGVKKPMRRKILVAQPKAAMHCSPSGRGRQWYLGSLDVVMIARRNRLGGGEVDVF